MAQEELVYTGVVRTPVFALASRAPLDGHWLGVMAEIFATAADVYRLTEELPPEADQYPSADGQDKSIHASARRLARMVGRDVESADLAVWRRLARWFADRQLDSLRCALARAISRDLLPEAAPIVGAGVGRFLARKLAEGSRRPYVDFAALVPIAGAEPQWVAYCAPAVALACLAYAR